MLPPGFSHTNYPHLYSQASPHPVASAPPFDPFEPSAPPLEESLDVPNAADECPICLEEFSKPPMDNASFSKILARTSCNHFFHDFCLQKHLKEGSNENCPLCRHPLSERTITQFSIADAALSNSPVLTRPVSFEVTHEEHENVLAGNGLSKVGKTALVVASLIAHGVWGLTRFAGRLAWSGTKTLVTSSIASKEGLDRAAERRATQSFFARINHSLEEHHKQMIERLERQKEGLQVTLARAISVWQRGDSSDHQFIRDQLKLLVQSLERQARSISREGEALSRDLQHLNNDLDQVSW